jgi:alkylated DNA repair dioxygenase AlkB
MRRAATQPTLFDTGRSLPNGFVYRPDFLSRAEEAELLGYIEDLPFSSGPFGDHAGKRQVINFGWSYDFEKNVLMPGPSLPPFLQPLQRKVAKWLDIPVKHVAEALITEYEETAAIGWHCDNETFESIIGISLGSWCNLRLRPLNSRMHARNKRDVITLPLEQRSAYLMQQESRWLFQHSIAPVAALRYSITLRTLPKLFPLPRPTRKE